MARAARLKVYRTPIGFHDAYVAAPSQKAALAAWGSSHDLFATGEAELVSDPSLTRAPLATPGKIVRRVRGTTAEHIAALPAEPKAQPEPRSKPPKAAAAPELRPETQRAVRLTPRPPPKPDRSAVDAAEAALAAALERQGQERQVLAEREQELRSEQQALETLHKAAAASLRKTIRAAEAAYAKASAQWRRASKGASGDRSQ